MKTHIEPTQEQNHSAISNSTKTSDTAGKVMIEDNRPSTVYQRKLQDTMNASATSKAVPLQPKANNTGLPDNLKTGIENLSGYSMDDVKVHYNSSKPAQLQAHAYAQGTDIHLAPRQEKHLPHEAWHVVQQKQGRVKPTKQLKSKVNINDDAGLEKEADVMGEKVMRYKPGHAFSHTSLRTSIKSQRAMQLKVMDPPAAWLEQYSSDDDCFAVVIRLVQDYNNREQGLNPIEKHKLLVRIAQALRATETEDGTEKDMRKVELWESVDEEIRSVISSVEKKDILPGKKIKISDETVWDVNNRGTWQSGRPLVRTGERWSGEITGETDQNEYTFKAGQTIKGKARKSALENDFEYEPIDEPLFRPGGPTINDIHQTNLGDCYLQSALISLAATRPDYIKDEMLHDLGRQVIVKLYKRERTAVVGQYRFTPQYIRVSKSVVVDRQTRRAQYNEGALWVKMVQKAFAASDLGQDYGRSKNISYEDIQSSTPQIAYQILMGKSVESFVADGSDFSEGLDADHEQLSPWSNAVLEYRELSQIKRKHLDHNDRTILERGKTILNAVFGSRSACRGGNGKNAWLDFLENHGANLASLKTNEELEGYLIQNGLEEGVRIRLMQYVREKRLLRGDPGIAVYLPSQIALFKQIETAINNGDVVTIGTKKTTKPAHATNMDVNGDVVVSGHAYTVLGVRELTTRDPDSGNPGPYYMIKLKNPHNKRGQTYDEVGGVLNRRVTAGDGTFWIELNDLAANYDTFGIGLR